MTVTVKGFVLLVSSLSKTNIQIQKYKQNTPAISLILHCRICDMFYIFQVGYYYTWQIQESTNYILDFQNIFSNSIYPLLLKAKQSMHLSFFVVFCFQNYQYTTKRSKRINNYPYIDCHPTLIWFR